MRKRRDSITVLKERIKQVNQAIILLEEKHGNLIGRLNNLNMQYEFGNMSFPEYSKLFNVHTGHLKAEEWQAHYISEIAKLKSELTVTEGRLGQLKFDKVESSLKGVITFAVLVFVVSFFGFIILPSFGLLSGQTTGAAVFSATPSNYKTTLALLVALLIIISQIVVVRKLYLGVRNK